MSNMQISQAIENLLVARNLRGMKTVQPALNPGYILRAAEFIQQATGNILIGTGFPVDETFETDGPLGAIALYRTIEQLGGRPVLVCGAPLANRLEADFDVHQISVNQPAVRQQEAQAALDQYNPTLVISIERPGLNIDGLYCNMLGEDISQRCASFDDFFKSGPMPNHRHR